VATPSRVIAAGTVEAAPPALIASTVDVGGIVTGA
jgi:hypothetical protein